MIRKREGGEKMEYPFRYPELYAELARQGKTKKDLASFLNLTTAGLRYKQDLATTGDFTGEEMKLAALFLNEPADWLFDLGGQKKSG